MFTSICFSHLRFGAMGISEAGLLPSFSLDPIQRVPSKEVSVSAFQ